MAMDYKEMLKLGALKLELETQHQLAFNKINEYLKDGKHPDNAEFQKLCVIKNFYADSIKQLNEKF